MQNSSSGFLNDFLEPRLEQAGILKAPWTAAISHLCPGDLIQQAAWLYVERSRKLLDHCNRRVSPTALNVADIGPMDACSIGIVLLTPAFAFTKAANI